MYTNEVGRVQKDGKQDYYRYLDPWIPPCLQLILGHCSLFSKVIHHFFAQAELSFLSFAMERSPTHLEGVKNREY